jgi:prepilin peptidase CpaA
MNAPLWVVIPVIVLVTAAARADVRTRKIPNLLTFTAMLLGIALHTAVGGGAGLQNSLTGLVLAGALLFPGYVMRWMGAGDVKLMAAVGAWLGYPHAVIAVLAALVAGGLMALAVAARRRMLGQALAGAAALGVWTLARVTRTAGTPPSTTGVRFPFAVSVAAGSLFALMIRL